LSRRRVLSRFRRSSSLRAQTNSAARTPSAIKMVMMPGPGVTTMTTPIASNVKPNTIRRYRLACWIVRITLSAQNRRSRNPTALLEAPPGFCCFDAANRQRDSKNLRARQGPTALTLAGDTHGADNRLRRARHSEAFVDSQKSENVCRGG